MKYAFRDARGKIVAFDGGAHGPFTFIDGLGKPIAVEASDGSGGGGGGAAPAVPDNPSSVARGDRVLTPDQSFASLFIPAGSLKITTYTANGTPNVQTIAWTKDDNLGVFYGVQAPLAFSYDARGYLVFQNTDGANIESFEASSEAILLALFGRIGGGVDTPIYVDAIAATEAELRRVIQLGQAIAPFTRRPVLSRAAAGMHALASEIVIPSVTLPNWGLVGQNPVAIPIIPGITLGGVYVGASPWGEGMYDITYTGRDFSMLVVGARVGIEGVAVGTPARDWPVACGGGIVQSKSNNACTIRMTSCADIPSVVSNLPLAGSDSATFTMWHYPSQISCPPGVSPFRPVNSRFLGIHAFGLTGTGNSGLPAGIYATGARTQFAVGNIAAGGFAGWPIFPADYASVTATLPDTIERSLFGQTRFMAGGNVASVASYRDAVLDFSAAAVLVSCGSFYEGIAGVQGDIKMPTNTIIGGCGTIGILAYESSEISAPVINYTIRGNSNRVSSPSIKCDTDSTIKAANMHPSILANSSPPCSPNSFGLGNAQSIIYHY